MKRPVPLVLLLLIVSLLSIRPSWAQEKPPEAEVGDGDRIAAQAGDDERIEKVLRDVFAAVEELAAVSVEVRSGVVKLSGDSASAEWSRKAGELAARIDGVLFVDNDVEPSLDVKRRLVPSFTGFIDKARGVLASLPLLAVALIVFVGFWFLGRLLENAKTLQEKMVSNPLLRGLLGQLLRTVVIALGLYFALEILGATALVGGILGTAGIVGLAVGFAFRDIVENYLASIILSIRRPFQPKDTIEIDGQSGTVIRLTSSDTVLMTPEGNHLRIPNAMVFKSRILNFTRNPKRRFDFSVGVGVDVDIVEAQDLGLGELTRMPGILDDPAPSCRVEELGDSNVLLRFFGWVDQHEADYFKVKSQAIRLVKKRLDQAEIDMPMPTYRIELDRGADRKTPEKKQPSPAPRHEVEAIDVSVDRHIEQQVDEDKARSGEGDLLTGKPAEAAAV